MMPRSDGIVLGGTSLRDNWSLDIEEKERQRVMDLHMELFDSMRAVSRPRTAAALFTEASARRWVAYTLL